MMVTQKYLPMSTERNGINLASQVQSGPIMACIIYSTKYPGQSGAIAGQARVRWYQTLMHILFLPLLILLPGQMVVKEVRP